MPSVMTTLREAAELELRPAFGSSMAHPDRAFPKARQHVDAAIILAAAGYITPKSLREEMEWYQEFLERLEEGVALVEDAYERRTSGEHAPGTLYGNLLEEVRQTRASFRALAGDNIPA